LIAVVVIGVLLLLGGQIKGIFTNIVQALGGH
jgi:Flp pilus assembly pilin Flp